MRNKNFYCKKCINHKGIISVEIKENGICNHCKDPFKYFVVQKSDEERLQKLAEMNIILDKMKKEHGVREFDCVLAYSGGKDSTYLLYLLSEVHKLNVLAVTADNGYMRKVAFENMKQTIDKLGVKHIVHTAPIDIFSKHYKWLIYNHNSHELPLQRPVCLSCEELIFSFVFKEAARRKIPYVFVGLSPDETASYFFEIPQEKLSRSWVPDHWYSELFTEEERKYWWDPDEFSRENIPRVLLPLHVWPYVEDEVTTTVIKRDLIKKGNTDPVKTNCILLWTIGIYDINRYGFHTYRVQLAKLVRQGRTSRWKWFMIFKMLERKVAKGKINKDLVEKCLNQIDITKEELLKLAITRRGDDPRKNLIEDALRYKKISLIA